VNLITTLAQVAADAPVGKMALFVDHLIAAIIYAVLGILILLVTLYAMVRFAPFSIHKEIEEDQNVALGIVIGAVLLGVALIIAAAISG
jgi:putative membrane protein